ncbi:MAG: DMT family transporter [Moraxellaceae bacterium]|nr:DMT family transporter [Moraxellaceae bacterium]MBH2031064.1 DMT family transporter [Moraxellaceae bacterium]
MGQLSKYQKWAFILPLMAVLIWSLNIAVTRYVADYISPVSISFYRWFVAFLILTPFMLPNVWKQRALIRPYIPKLAVLSAFGMVLYQGLSYTAAHYTTATNMGIVNAFVPVFTIFISYIILKDKPNRFAIFGSFLSFLGLLYVMSQGHFSRLFDQGGHWGDMVMVIAVGFYTFYGVFLKKWQLQLPLMTSLYIQIVFALLYHAPFLLWLGLDSINAENVASVLYAGIFPSLIAPLLWMIAVQAIGPNRTSIFMNLMPVFTAIIATFWLSEHWTIYHTIGGVTILVGIILAQKKTTKTAVALIETSS